MLTKIAISTLVETKNNSKYLITYLDEGIKLLVLILPKITWYIKTFKIKDGDKGKNKKLMSFRIYDDKLLQKHKKYFDQDWRLNKCWIDCFAKTWWLIYKRQNKNICW